MGEIFDKIEQKTVTNQIVERVKELIVTKKMKSGDRLPSETQLASELSVARGSIREAMTILKAQGVVQIIRGKGMFVSTGINGNCYEGLFLDIMTAEYNFEMLSDLRKMIETGIFNMILQRYPEDNFQRLLENHEQMKTEIAQKAPVEKILELDYQFHDELGKYTGNVLVEKIYMFTLELLKPTIIRSYEIQALSGNYDAISMHMKIIEALQTRNMNEMLAVVEDELSNWKHLFNMAEKSEEIKKSVS